MTSLKQIPIEKRITFLKKFTTEVVLSLIKEIHIKQRVEKEKIKQKILSPIREPIITISPVFQPSKFQSVQKEGSKEEVLAMSNQRTIDINQLRKPMVHRARIPRQIPIQIKNLQKTPRQPNPQEFKASRQIPTQPKKISPQLKSLKETKPEAKPRPKDLALGRIESLLRDREIQLIECPGPNKNLLIKRYNKINTTKIILSQVEITEILYSFAKEAKIPVVGGILKAAVGDLVVSAVISEFVGSRFIINKLTPYSLIQK